MGPLPQALQATEGQTEELRGHVIIAGFGRVGQLIGQLLAERLIPFVAVDVRMECVQVPVLPSCMTSCIGHTFAAEFSGEGSNLLASW
jgi:phosphoribosylcarboxyaminoimidazole (NCAIR) mutase